MDDADSVPNLRGRMPRPPWRQAVGILAVPLAGLCLLTWLGEPALRVEYIYQGTYERPRFEQCTYRMLFGQWTELRLDPAFQTTDACPVIRTFPFNLQEYLP